MSDEDKDKSGGVVRPRGLKKLLLGLVVGLLLGGGGAAGFFLFLQPKPAAVAPQPEAAKPVLEAVFVKLDRLSAPVISGDVVLGYMLFDLSLEVKKASDELLVVKRLPALRAAFLREVTSTSIGKPDQPFVVDYDGLTGRLKEVANRELGQGVLSRVLVVQTTRI
ncbi:hypothetical protein [Govanella unica]|uniref:Flagellar protein FliL n=1 Tax=Govanella unica TaxID=2975056 RepID=A0A9X3TZ59_9PROT|nr:hypothetical protein [Govania unica]MDA5194092.1 hypothetical protein [Govania unica]